MLVEVSFCSRGGHRTSVVEVLLVAMVVVLLVLVGGSEWFWVWQYW